MSEVVSFPTINRGDNLFLQKCKLIVDPLYIDCWPRTNRGNRLSMRKWKLTVDPFCVDHWCPLGSTEAITFSHESESWLLIFSTLTVDPLHWLLTLSTLTVGPPYIDLTLSTLIVDPLYIDCWPSLHWLLIHLMLTLSTLTVDPLYIECWPSTLTVDPLHVNCQSAPPPGSTEAITFSHESESWLLILSTLIIDSPPGSTVFIAFVLTVDSLCVDCRSTPPYRFQLSNL